MATLTPVDYDPFGSSQDTKLTPVDYDPFAEPKKKAPDVGIAEDTAKGAASGLAKGAVGLPGVFGDLRQIAKEAPWAPKRSMMDALLEKAGVKEIPTSEDFVKAASEIAPGINYKPQTLPGQYANTIGSFVPGAVLGGEASAASMAKNAARFGVIPGAVSETAGQAFEGTPNEGAARAVGAIAGMAGRNIPGRIVSPIEQRPEIAGAVKALEQEGVPLTAGQKTGNKTLQWLEAAAADMPLSAKSSADIQAAQSGAFNRAAAKRMGYDIADPRGQMTPDEWNAVKDEFNTRYGQLNARSTMRSDNQLTNDVDQAFTDYQSMKAPGQMAPIVERWKNDINNIPTTHNGALSGDTYQSWRSDLATAARKAEHGSSEASALTEMKHALDNAMNRSTSPALKPIRDQLNREYANYKLLQDAAGSAGETAARDYISPAILRSKSAKKKSLYLQGKSDLGELAKSAEAVMKPLPSSGTAQRQAAMNMFQPSTAGAGFLAGGVPGALAGYVAPSLLARAIMSKPGQAYLSNQAAKRIGLLSKDTNKQRAFGLINALKAYDE